MQQPAAVLTNRPEPALRNADINVNRAYTRKLCNNSRCLPCALGPYTLAPETIPVDEDSGASICRRLAVSQNDAAVSSCENNENCFKAHFPRPVREHLDDSPWVGVAVSVAAR